MTISNINTTTTTTTTASNRSNTTYILEYIVGVIILVMFLFLNLNKTLSETCLLLAVYCFRLCHLMECREYNTNLCSNQMFCDLC